MQINFNIPRSFYQSNSHFYLFKPWGWFTWSGLIYAFGLVPLLDAIIPSTTENMTKIEEDIAKKNRIHEKIITCF